MCTSQTTVVLSRKKKNNGMQWSFSQSLAQRTALWNRGQLAHQAALTEVIKTEALFVGQKGGKGVNSFLFTVCPYPIWSQAWYLENPGCFKHQEWEEKKCRFQHCFWRDFFVRFSTIEKLKHKEKVPVTSGMQNELWGSFQKSIFKINRCLTPTKRGNSRNSFRPMLSSAHALVTLPGIWNGGYKEKKTEKSASYHLSFKNQSHQSFPYISSFTNPIWRKDRFPTSMESFFIACWPPPLNGSPRQSDHALAASAAPIDSAHASPSAPSTFHGHHARQGKKPAMFWCFHWVWKCRRWLLIVNQQDVRTI